jgi:hypothetical protein
VGTKVTYENRLYAEVRPGTQQYARQRISQTTFQLPLVDAEKASVTAAKTTWDPRGGVNHSSNDLTYRAKEVAPPMELPGNPPREKIQTTRGEESLVISGKSIATKWERIALADDPSTYIKTWTSDDIPGGLVLRRNDVSRAMGRTMARSTNELIYAPVQGTEPEVTSGSAQEDPGVVSRPQELTASWCSRERRIHVRQCRSPMGARASISLRTAPGRPFARPAVPVTSGGAGTPSVLFPSRRQRPNAAACPEAQPLRGRQCVFAFHSARDAWYSVS